MRFIFFIIFSLSFFLYTGQALSVTDYRENPRSADRDESRLEARTQPQSGQCHCTEVEGGITANTNPVALNENVRGRSRTGEQ